MECITTNIKIPLELWRQFRILAICKDKTLNENIILAIEKMVKEEDNATK